MTPPSRISIGGFSISARSSSAAHLDVLADLPGQGREQRRVEARQLSPDAGRELQRQAQLAEVAGPRRLQRDPREDALEIADRSQAHRPGPTCQAEPAAGRNASTAW